MASHCPFDAGTPQNRGSWPRIKGQCGLRYRRKERRRDRARVAPRSASRTKLADRISNTAACDGAWREACASGLLGYGFVAADLRARKVL